MCWLCGPGETLWATGRIFGAGFVGMGRAPPAQYSKEPAVMVEREGGIASGEKVRLGDKGAERRHHCCSTLHGLIGEARLLGLEELQGE